MQVPGHLSSPERIILDYLSPYGPSVTHMRGTVISGALSNLKGAGFYDRYVGLLPSRYRETVIYGLASSWVTIDAVIAHYAACDELGLSERELEHLGSMMANRIANTFLAGPIRKSRAFGVEAFRWAMSHVSVLHERIYKGGVCAVIETGPKDLIHEVHGFPFAQSRYFRRSYASYCRALAALFCKVAFVKPVRARAPLPDRIAIAYSWV